MTVDVLVYNEKTYSNQVYRNAIPKKDAKKLMKELRQKGFKVQMVTSKGVKTTTDIAIPEFEESED